MSISIQLHESDIRLIKERIELFNVLHNLCSEDASKGVRANKTAADLSRELDANAMVLANAFMHAYNHALQQFESLKNESA